MDDLPQFELACRYNGKLVFLKNFKTLLGVELIAERYKQDGFEVEIPRLR